MSENAIEHSRRLDSPSEFIDFAEHLTYMADKAVGDVEFPMQVSVTIEVDDPEAWGECQWDGCEKDAESVILYEDVGTWEDFCRGHAGAAVQSYDAARTFGGNS